MRRTASRGGLDRRPVLADSTTLDLLEHLLAQRLGIPVVGTCRLDDPDTSVASRARHHRVERSESAKTLDLGMLSRDESAELQRQVARREIDAPYIDRIHQHSAGHPLFTELLASTAPGQPLPRVLFELLDRRIADLSPHAERVVHVLAVADRALPGDLAVTVVGVDEAEFADGLRELSDRSLLAIEAPQV